MHDFRDMPDLVHAELCYLSSAPGGANNRQALWNAAEAAERRADARVTREYIVALPNELPTADQLDLTRRYAETLVERYGCAIDIAVHAHLLATTRILTADGFTAKT